MKQTLMATIALGAWLTSTHSAHAQFTLLNVGHTNDSSSGGVTALGVAVSGDYAYVAYSYGDLYAYDVSDPSHPINVSRTSFDYGARAVACAGSYVYVVTDTGLRIYELTDPANPVLLGYTNFSGGAYTSASRLRISGNFAYTVGSGPYSGFCLYDVADPAHPRILSQILGSTLYGAMVRGNYAYLVGEFLGANAHSLRIYDLSNPANPALIGQTTNQIRASDIALAGNYALVPTGSPSRGLYGYDVSDPTHPLAVLDTWWQGDPLKSIVVSGNYAYTLTPFLQMADISNPLNPVKVGQAIPQGKRI